MFIERVVPIPNVPGKIVRRNINGSVYIEYEVRRVYDRSRKQNIPERVRIGIQIPGRAGMMLPNENYLSYFSEEEKKMTEEEKEKVRDYTEEREYGKMLREFFDMMYFELQIISRKKPNSVVSGYKVERINRILKPLIEMMKGQKYEAFLEEIPAPVEVEEDGRKVVTGLTYSDVGLMLTQVKGAVNRYFRAL